MTAQEGLIKECGYSAGQSMRDLIRDNNLLLMTISRFGIPFGFGDDTVEKICRENGTDVETFLTVCNLLSGNPFDPKRISLQELMKYLERAHSSFLDVTLPRIRRSLIDGITHSETDQVALLLMKFFDDYVAEVRKHMEHENEVVFSYARSLLAGKPDPEFTISEYSSSHDDSVTKLNELKDIFIYHFKQGENIKLSQALFDIIVCEKDIISHFDVESRLFIPAVERLENEMRAREAAEEATSAKTGNSALDILSEREKDIIREVARGKSNKEIADSLCISVHTVTTHRRNISNKLEIHSTGALVIFALIHHLIELPG